MADLSRFLSSSQLELMELMAGKGEHSFRIPVTDIGFGGAFRSIQAPPTMTRIKKIFSSAPLHFRDPGGMVMPDLTPEELMPDASTLGQGYPKNEVFYITIIEDPPITMDPQEQKPPRMALKPTPFLAPSLEIAFIMAGKSTDLLADADLQRCRVRVAHG